MAKHEIVDPAAVKCPKDFGRGGLSCHCSVYSREARSDKKAGLGWK